MIIKFSGERRKIAPALLRRREPRRFSSASDDDVAGSRARDA
jgi:hypothetical protein